MIPALLALVLAAPQGQPALTIGSPAPELKVERWMQGTPVQIEPKGIYVLEFWATWCVPCIEAMPHLSRLSEKYKDKATFIGVNIADRRAKEEQTPKSQVHVDRVAAWLKQNAGKMTYGVVLDDSEGTVNRNWMLAAGKNSIPTTFIVQDRKVVWIGHPGVLDEPLAQIVEGKYDLAAAKAKAEEDRARTLKVNGLRALAAKGDLAAVETAFVEFKAKDPKKGIDLIVPLAHALAEAKPEAGVTFLERRAADTYDDATFLVMIGYAIHPKVEKDAAAMQKLADFTAKHVLRVPDAGAAISYAYHALILFKVGERRRAMEWALRAEAKVDLHEPERTRENIRNFVAGAKKQIEGR